MIEDERLDGIADLVDMSLSKLWDKMTGKPGVLHSMNRTQLHSAKSRTQLSN